MLELTHPKPSKSRQKAALITAGLILAIYILLSIWSVHQPMQQLEIYERLDWYKFTPLPEPKTTPQPKEETPEKEKRKDVINAAKDLPAPPKVEVDLEELRQVLKIDQAPVVPNRPQQKSNTASAPTVGKIEINELLPEETMEPLFKGDGPAFPLPSGLKSKKSSASASSLTLENTGPAGIRNNMESLKKTGPVLAGPGGKSTGKRPVQEIALKDLSRFGQNYSNLDPIFKALVEWMKKHPAPHPPAIQSLTRQGNRDQDALRSVVVFRSGDRIFTLYLKCIESLYEIHIVLIENTNLAYLIDQGFKKRSHFLRLGSATYSDEAKTQLVSCNTTYEKPSDRRTKEFYQVFYSWWDSVKDSVQKDRHKK